MGVSIEQWRATIGHWSGGRVRNYVPLQNCIAQTSNPVSYKQIRFLLLVSLLVIGCVELNPGPDHVTSATSESDGRRPGTGGRHGYDYENKMAAFLFARALHESEEFYLFSNFNNVGAFDDLVLRYRPKEEKVLNRLRDQKVWKTCFIQLKHRKPESSIEHKKDGDEIPFAELVSMSGKCSLLKYFESYCQISKASADGKLKHCGPFHDFEFVMYTNARLEVNLDPQGDENDPLSILSSGTDCGKYITFNEASDEAANKKIFTFFKELSEYHKFLVDLDKLFAGGTFRNTEIEQKIEEFKCSVTNTAIKGKLGSLKKSNSTKDCVTRMIKELGKCDFDLYKYEDFLNKVKIFHSQSNEESLEGLIEKELNVTCKASPSLLKSIYTKFEKGVLEWWKNRGNDNRLSKNSPLWQDIVKHLITEIKRVSEPEPETHKFAARGIRFNQQHIQTLFDAIKCNTLLNIVTSSDIHYLHQLKTYQALEDFGYTNSLFIGSKSLKLMAKVILKFWPCKWSAALVIDCDFDVNVARILLDILQDSVGCEQGLEISDENLLETLVAVLQEYGQKVIIISTGQHINLASTVQEKLGNITAIYKDNCVVSDFDAESQIQILQRNVNFQGEDVTLDKLVDKDQNIKSLIDSNIISILLSSEHKLCVGTQLSDLPVYYIPRVLQHHVSEG